MLELVVDVELALAVLVTLTLEDCSLYPLECATAADAHAVRPGPGEGVLDARVVDDHTRLSQARAAAGAGAGAGHGVRCAAMWVISCWRALVPGGSTLRWLR